MIDKRLMYAQGQRVAKTLNGSRPGYGGPHDSMGDKNTSSKSSNTGGGNGGNTNREKGIMSQYSGPKGTTKNINDFSSDPGGVDRSAVSQFSNYGKAKMNQSIKDVSKIGKENFFDTGPGKFIKGLGKTALMAYGPVAFGPKFATGAKIYKTAKIAKDFLDKATVGTSLTNLFNNNKTLNNKSIKSVSKIGTDKTKFGGDGQNGIAGLEAMSLLENEYILLLQKLQAGSISENDKSRFGVLKQMLGK